MLEVAAYSPAAILPKGECGRHTWLRGWNCSRSARTTEVDGIPSLRRAARPDGDSGSEIDCYTNRPGNADRPKPASYLSERGVPMFPGTNILDRTPVWDKFSAMGVKLGGSQVPRSQQWSGSRGPSERSDPSSEPARGSLLRSECSLLSVLLAPGFRRVVELHRSTSSTGPNDMVKVGSEPVLERCGVTVMTGCANR